VVAPGSILSPRALPSSPPPFLSTGGDELGFPPWLRRRTGERW
jgi:hypothetical protein